MDLEVKEVAELLNISVEKVLFLVKGGEIPYYELAGELRFNPMEIEHWMMSHGEKPSRKTSSSKKKISLPSKRAHKLLEKKVGTQAFSLFRAILKGGIFYQVPGESKEEIIRYTVKKIAQELRLDGEFLSELLLDREKLMSTALNEGVAVPHTRDFLLPTSFDIITLVYPEKAIDYGALDGKPVEFLFFLFACEKKRHLHLLAKLAHLARSEENLSFLKSKPDRETLLDFFKKWEMKVSLPL